VLLEMAAIQLNNGSKLQNQVFGFKIILKYFKAVKELVKLDIIVVDEVKTNDIHNWSP
jgi:hypothetical protein